MDKGFSLEEAVRARYSVRTYEGRALDAAEKERLLAYAAAIENPFGPPTRIQFIERDTAPGGEKLGTYGIIKGAKTYVATSIEQHERAPEALGYAFEQFVLYATSLGLGTCWLGGTFNRGAFASSMELREGEIFPILSPIGRPAAKMSVTERLMRTGVKADKRLDWDQLFFSGDFSTPLAKAKIGPYAFALEMVRLGPSAANKQPWRIVRQGDAYHFFQKGSMGGVGGHAVDMHRIDLGIALCHFHLAAQERGLPGAFVRLGQPPVSLPDGVEYVVSWQEGA